MTKKRLSDLLREEVQKGDEAEQPEAATIDVSHQAVEDAADTDSSDDESPDADGTETTASQKRTSRTTKAELNDMVTELEAQLAASQQREADFQQQIKDLQTDLQEQQVLVRQLTAKLDPANRQVETLKTDLESQKALMKRLQSDLEQANKLKDELAEARQVILQLSESNTQLQESAKAPTRSPQPDFRSAPTAPAPAAPAPAPLARTSSSRPLMSSPAAQPVSVPELEDNTPSPPLDPHRYQPALKKLREQSVRHDVPKPKPSMLSDDEIGWVD